MAGANQLYSADSGYQPYPGATQAAMNPNLTSALTGMSNIATGDLGGTAGVKASQGLGLNMIQNQGLSPELKSLLQQQQGQENPYLQSILASNNQRIGDRINSSMSGSGRYGSGAHTDLMARSLAEMANPILAQDYTQRQQMQQNILQGGLERAGQWSQLMPTLDQAQYAPAQQLAGVGQYLTERDQSALNDYIKTYNIAQARPWEQLARFNAIVGGAGALGGQTVGSQTTPINQPSTLQRLFGGAAAGAGIGGSFGGPAGAGLGALGGGLLGML